MILSGSQPTFIFGRTTVLPKQGITLNFINPIMKGKTITEYFPAGDLTIIDGQYGAFRQIVSLNATGMKKFQRHYPTYPGVTPISLSLYVRPNHAGIVVGHYSYSMFPNLNFPTAIHWIARPLA
jgi:hypothetical protein